MKQIFLIKSVLLICITQCISIKDIAQIYHSSNNSSNKISEINKNWEPGGIFNGEDPQKEILKARTAYTKKFDKGNGIIDMVFGGPFHYLDKKDDWQDIDLKINRQVNGSYAFTNETNAFISWFAQQTRDGVKMEYKNQSIRFGISPTIMADNWVPSISKNSSVLSQENIIKYKNYYNGVDLEYGLTTDAIQHKMIFNNKNVLAGLSGQQFILIEETIELPLNASLADEKGEIVVNREVHGNLFVIINNDTLYTILSAHIWDASFMGDILESSKAGENPNGLIDIKTNIAFLSQSKIKLIASVPVDWLTATNRKYPITFDPTVNIGNASSFGSTYRYPFNTCRQQRVSQILFRKSDINAGGTNTTGTITKIEFLQYTNNPLPNNNIKIKMQEVSWDEMTQSTLTTSGFTTCYGPTSQNYTSGGSNTWRALDLTSPFPYSNTNNLLIEVSFNNSPVNTQGCTCGTTTIGGHWGYFNAPYHGHRWAYSNSSATPPSGTDCNYVNSPEDNPAYGALIPATRITINTSSGCAPADVTANPVSRSIVVPTQAQFSVSATGTTLTYQWQISTDGGINWTNVIGANYSGVLTNQLTVSPTSIAMNGNQFRCKILNSCTTPPEYSTVAVLTVNASGCTSSITPSSSPNILSTGGGGSFAINVTPNTCSWSASVSQSWITITSALSGGGDATLTYTIGNNQGSARSGTITVNGQNYAVNQLGIAAPNSYIITGRVLTTGSSGLAGVTISTVPSQGTTVTDAQGYYSLSVPLSYTGTVNPSFSPFTFTPTSHIVSTSNKTGKDFDAVGVSMSVVQSIIPPFQREGDNYSGSVTVQINNTTTASWHLEADVYDANNSHLGNVIFPSISGTTYSFSTQTTNNLPIANQQLKILSVRGNTVKYSAVFDANSTIQSYPGVSTTIIEKKWDKENVFFYNRQLDLTNSLTNIGIPLKHVPNAKKINILFDVDKNTCSTSPKAILLNGSMPFSGDATLIYDPNTTMYIKINSSTSNICNDNVLPGEYTCFIQYLDANGNLLPTEFEYETFELTKMGRITSINNSTKIVVFVGGWNNKIENDIMDLKPNDVNANAINSFSLSKYNGWLNKNFETWYIAQAGTNFVQRNAYSIGKAIDNIISILPNVQEIDLITHSKGGLDVRALIGGYATPYKYFNPPQNNHIDVQNKISFSAFACHSKIQKIVFLTAPNNGANYLANVANVFGGSPAIKELSKQSHYGIINELNNNARIPTSISIGNLTAYKQVAGSLNYNGILINTNTSFDFTDGIVEGESSDCVSDDQSVTSLGPSQSKPLKRDDNNNVHILQMYQHAIPPFSPTTRVHTIIHESNTLSNYLPSVYSVVNQTSSSFTNLEKIVSFIQNGISSSIPTCPRPSISHFCASLTASILSGANLSVKFKNDPGFYRFGISDENGIFNGTVIPSLQYWDSIKVESNGVESIKIPVGSELINSGKLNVAMFKFSILPNLIQYPALALINQDPITNLPVIQLKVTAKNVANYLINQNSSDSNFVPLVLNNAIASIPLDTGYNLIIVKFCGIDTAVQMKEIYYLPDTLMSDYTMNCTINIPTQYENNKLFVNNVFYKDLKHTENIKLLRGVNEIKFRKYGYRDRIFIVDTITAINLTLQPYSYSSNSDSTIINFNDGLNPQYWKTITVKNLRSSPNQQLSIMQYDDPFSGMSLIPLTRKFVFRKLGSSVTAAYKTAIALDQINTPDKDSIYLLSIRGNNWTKYRVNQLGITEYDPEVQKIEFDELNFTTTNDHSIVLMQKQAPLMKPLDTVWHSGQTLVFPLGAFIGDPDSIKNDLSMSSSDPKVSVIGNSVYITAPTNFVGTTSFTLSGIHDFIEVSKSYVMKVLPPEAYIPNAFTPNGDGRNDLLMPIFMGKIVSCHFVIYNRNGNKVFETTDCSSGWNGKIKGVDQKSEVFVWTLRYQFVGEETKETKGSVVLIK